MVNQGVSWYFVVGRATSWSRDKRSRYFSRGDGHDCIPYSLTRLPPGLAVDLTDARIVSPIRPGRVLQTIEHNEAIAYNHAYWIEAFVASVGWQSCLASPLWTRKE